jgi:FkbM family methyltransferase
MPQVPGQSIMSKPSEADACRKFVTPKNVGVYRVKAAREVGSMGLVVAVEPFIDTAYRRAQNIKLNRYQNVRVRNLCVGAKTEQASFYLNESKPHAFVLFTTGNPVSISVLTASLDDLCRWEGLTRLDYLKIDAEGAEKAILTVGENVIQQFRPVIQVEIEKHDAGKARGYTRFTAPNSPNAVLIPVEKVHARLAAQSLGWSEVST